tara:strand:+ start:10668 stop:13439 length:2772 start_codon:yes stop_codon:yes gene_type:complete
MRRCITLNKTEKSRKENWLDIAMEFDKDSAVKAYGFGHHHFNRLFKASTGRHMEGSKTPSVEELKLLKRNVGDFVKNINKGELSEAQKLFYLTKEVAKQFPASERWYSDMENANARFKGDNQAFSTLMRDIHSKLSNEAGSNGLSGLLGGKGSAQKELIKREAKFKEYIKKGNYDLAMKYREKEIEPFVTSGEGKVFKDFLELATNDSKWNNRPERFYSANVVNAVGTWRNKLLPHLDILIKKGMKNYMETYKAGYSSMGDFKGYRTLEQKLTTIESYINNIGKQGNSFPIKNLDILPTLGKTNELIAEGTKESILEASKGLDNLIETVIKNDTSINEFITKSEQKNDMVSYNVLGIMDTYTKSVSRFNFAAFNTKSYVKAIQEFSRMQDKSGKDTEFGKAVDSMVDYMSDTYSTSMGLKADKNTSNISRALTAWQAISKLGFPNLKSPAKNATQSLQNWVYFGWNGIKETRAEMKNTDMLSRVNEGLADNGILFPNITEVYSKDFMPNRKKDPETGLWVDKIDTSIGDAFVERIARVAEITNKPMTWVENKINRRSTYKMAYVKKWKADNADIGYLNRKFERGLGHDRVKEMVGKDNYNPDMTPVENLKAQQDILFGNKTSSYEMQFEMFRRARADRFSRDVVTELHYDYDVSAKPNIMTGPVGAVATQFQTFSVNFFNYQRKILKQGKNEVMSGMWGGEGAWRMYRLGMLYTVLGGLVSPMVNSDLLNLVENDTANRLLDMNDFLFSDDDKKRERALFGRGLSSFAGPTVSDALKLGQVAGYMNFDDNDWKNYVFGYQDFANSTNDEKTQELVRTVSVGLGRTLYDHVPRTINGQNIGTTFTNELGLYDTDSNKAMKHVLKNHEFSPVKPIYDKLIKPFVMPTKAEQKIALQRRQGAGTGNSGSREAILSSLDKMYQTPNR